ncbi:hypothetical protein C2845_PM06G30230 [Panicum miliaceum]|uniref:Uncharacterized protein n=1 Tax=Panicum miliaceum TaxID=4540 RepID=A0A3L6RCU1_PANMI|nr:hypothetical protein C2845_PM06G30230 [Panicum miliaceum]
MPRWPTGRSLARSAGPKPVELVFIDTCTPSLVHVGTARGTHAIASRYADVAKPIGIEKPPEWSFGTASHHATSSSSGRLERSPWRRRRKRRRPPAARTRVVPTVSRRQGLRRRAASAWRAEATVPAGARRSGRPSRRRRWRLVRALQSRCRCRTSECRSLATSTTSSWSGSERVWCRSHGASFAPIPITDPTFPQSPRCSSMSRSLSEVV